jgi:type VI secretion system protein ImpH
MDAGSQLLIALTTDNEQEAQGWKPDGLLYQDFLVMLRVYLGGGLRQNHSDHPDLLLAAPPLGEGRFWLGMNGVLGAEDEYLLTISRRPLRRNWAITPGCSPQTTTRKPTCYVQIQLRLRAGCYRCWHSAWQAAGDAERHRWH